LSSLQGHIVPVLDKFSPDLLYDGIHTEEWFRNGDKGCDNPAFTPSKSIRFPGIFSTSESHGR